VLGSFDGREWKSLSAPPEGMWRIQPQADLHVSGEPVRYQLTQEPHQLPWALVMDAAPEPPALPGRRLRMTPDLQWISDRPFGELVRFDVTSYPAFRHGPLQKTPALRAFTELPPGYNPRTLQLAADMQADPTLAGADTAALVNAALLRLRTGGYTYTLEPGVSGQHSADEFWFDTKAGFCEHIASAFVVLMRGLDIPSRIVTGYQGGELNGVDGYWTVRQSDAHAWAEVWEAGQGWVRVDPTSAVAPGRIGAAQRLQAPRGAVGTALTNMVGAGAIAGLRAAWEAVNNGWNQWVLNYTQTSQVNLLKKLGFEAPGWEDLLRVLAGLVAAAALLGVAWARWERQRQDPWLRLLEQARQRLQDAGLALGHSTPARGMAQAARQQFGDAAAPVAAWLLRLEMLRYAPGGDNTPQGATHPARALQTLRREFHQLAWPARPR
jgi:transglutaminase-like putative cysteine protease